MVSFSINSAFLFPSPKDVLWELWILISGASNQGDVISSNFWLITCLSLLRILWGILVSILIGTVLAYITSVSRLLRALLTPALSAIKSTPVASFIILALLWLDRNVLPVFITALIVIPIIWANVSEGIRRVDKNLLEVAEIYRFSAPKKLIKLYVPSVAPYFMAACQSSLGMAWKAGIAAEVLSTPDHSIGKELYNAKTYMETPRLFAWTLIVILLSYIIEKLLVFALNRLGKRLRILPQGGAQHVES